MEAATELPIVVVDGWAFEATEFLCGKDHVNGYELARRVRNMSNLAGRPHADLLLIRQDVIPVGWRMIIPVFADDIKRGPRGYRGVAHLCWCDRFQRWYRDFRWLGWGFGKDCRLVRFVPVVPELEHLTPPSL